MYEREGRPWLPHVTVLRFRSRPRLDPPVPDLGQFRPSDAAVYMSALRPTGAQYRVLESVPLEVDRMSREEALDTALGQIERQPARAPSCG